jgi:RNA polymerase sigma factor (sigma-70 family)
VAPGAADVPESEPQVTAPDATPVMGGPDAAAGAAPESLVADLFQEHALSLVRLAVILTGDRVSAEDVVQDAFLGLHRALPRLRGVDNALPYLRVSVLNGCRSLRRSRVRASRRDVEYAPPVWSAEAAAIASEERRAVLTAVAALPQRAREVLALRFYLGMPDNDIAKALGVSRGTVSSTASRALATLARHMKEQP